MRIRGRGGQIVRHRVTSVQPILPILPIPPVPPVLPLPPKYNRSVNERPPRPQRADSREVAELKLLKTTQPELAPAVDMQLALVDMQRRVQGRVPLPWIDVDPEWLKAQGNAIEPLVKSWYERTSGHDTSATPTATAPAAIDQVLILAMRPFLARCAEAMTERIDVSTWKHGHCPFCGWEPDFAVITPSADRRLVCGRCVAQWTFAQFTCPFCANDDRALITSFATRDGRYRVYGCDVCRRYLKAYDARNAQRPALVAVDTIATLPLDAAAIQRGYLG